MAVVEAISAPAHISGPPVSFIFNIRTIFFSPINHDFISTVKRISGSCVGRGISAAIALIESVRIKPLSH
jgi:hypothetical protein